MSRGLAETGDAAPCRRDRPNVDGGNVFLRGGEMARLRRGEADLVEQQRIMPAIVEKQEGHAADEVALPAESQDALGIEGEVFFKLSRPDPDTRHQPVRQLRQRSYFGKLGATDVDIRTERQRVEIMPCGKRAPFHTHVTPLSFAAFVPRYDQELRARGSGVCRRYCTGAPR